MPHKECLQAVLAMDNMASRSVYVENIIDAIGSAAPMPDPRVLRAEGAIVRTAAIVARLREVGRSRRLVASVQTDRTSRTMIAREAGTLEDIAETIEREFARIEAP